MVVRPTPDPRTIQRVCLKFENTYCLMPRHKKVVQPNKRIPEHVQVEVCAVVAAAENGYNPLDGEKITVRNIAQRFAIGKSKAGYILKKYGFRAYKKQRHQELRIGDDDRRLTFCGLILEEFDNNPQLLWNICFTDEAKFLLRLAPNWQNDRVWRSSRPTDVLEVHTQYQVKINVWAGMYGTNIIGPFFYEESLTGDKYLQMLQQQIIPAIEAVQAQRGVSIIKIQARFITLTFFLLFQNNKKNETLIPNYQFERKITIKFNFFFSTPLYIILGTSKMGQLRIIPQM